MYNGEILIQSYLNYWTELCFKSFISNMIFSLLFDNDTPVQNHLHSSIKFLFKPSISPPIFYENLLRESRFTITRVIEQYSGSNDSLSTLFVFIKFSSERFLEAIELFLYNCGSISSSFVYSKRNIHCRNIPSNCSK